MNRIRRIAARVAGVLMFACLTALGPHAFGVVVVRRSVYYRPRPVAPVAAVAATAAVTAVAVGTVVRSLPPSCRTVMVGNVAYQQCGSTWYQPRYAGSEVSYVVVTAPR